MRRVLILGGVCHALAQVLAYRLMEEAGPIDICYPEAEEEVYLSERLVEPLHEPSDRHYNGKPKKSWER